MQEKALRALAGIRVADFTIGAAGPLIGRYLAEHGAEVVKVESFTRPDADRISSPFKNGIRGLDRGGLMAYLCGARLSVALALDTTEGQEIARKLVLCSDVVIESFRVGAMEKWGLGYEELSRARPEIIMLRTTSQGQTGPRSKASGFGGTLKGLAGFAHLCGWKDSAPSLRYPYTDFTVPPFGVVQVIAALILRQRTGKGRLIDLSQYEASLPFIAPALLDYAANGCIQTRCGNESPFAVPHNAYRCRGDDEWCVIAVFDDAEWQALCQVAQGEKWAKDPKFATFAGRKSNEMELDRLVGQWTANWDAFELMEALQKAGVRAGKVQNAQDILEHDPQLKQRGFIVPLENPEVGKHWQAGWPARFSRTPTELKTFPLIGQDNYYVCHELLGMSDEEIADLVAREIVQTQ